MVHKTEFFTPRLARVEVVAKLIGFAGGGQPGSDLRATWRYLRGVDPNQLAAEYYGGCQRAHRSVHLVTAPSHRGSS